jgi:hypothetical protein
MSPNLSCCLNQANVQCTRLLKTFDKVVLLVAFFGIIIAIPAFIIERPSLESKLAAVVAVIVIGLVIKFWENLRGEEITKKLGNPYSTQYRVQHYRSREDLSFEELVNVVKNEIILVSISHKLVARFQEKVIRDAIVNRGVTITVMLLKPDSTFISEVADFFAIPFLANNIKDALIYLCKQKRVYLQVN